AGPDNTAPEILDFLTHIMQEVKEVGFDIEVFNHQISCLSFSIDERTSMSIPFVDEGDRWDERTEADIWLAIARVLENAAIAKIMCYGMFDASFILSTNNIHIKGDIRDVYLASRILYPDFPASLQFLTSLYTDQPYYKDDRKLWNRIREDPITFWLYSARDSVVLPQIWEELSSELLADPDYQRMYDRTIALWEPCLYMMTNGIRINVEALKELKAEVTYELEIKAADLEKASDYTFNPNSPKQCLQYFYEHKNIRPYISRRTGKPTCDDKALTRIIRRYNLPEARLAQDIRGLGKLLNTYLDLQYDDDDRLRCFYNPRGTTTGRLSSSKTVRETGLNFQNLHPRFKRFLVVDE
ncbi:hypothetical protein LCGC14_2404350, partial [marine sediment metagenome]